MKKIFSMFLIFIMVMPSFLVNAADTSCLITFNGPTPTYTIDGTHAFISGHHNDDAITASYDGKTGWVLTPTTDKSVEDYGYNTIYINLADSFMNNLPGTQDVMIDVCYYDGNSPDKGSKFCVYYVSQNHINENAGVVTLGGSGAWKTHTFTLENPRLADVGNTPLRNIAISVNSTYMGASSGSVVIGTANVYYGETRKLFFELKSENVGNIFFNQESIGLNMIFENPYSIQHGELTAKLALTNTTDNAVYQTEDNILIGSSENLMDTINLDSLNLPFGTYDVSADIYSGDELIVSTETTLSRISAKGIGEPSHGGINNSFLGINTHASRYGADTVKDLVYLADRSGTGHIRTTLSWESIEKTAGEYAVPLPTMTLLEEAKEHNIKVTAVVGNRNSGVYPDYKPWRTGSTEENFQNYLGKYAAYIEYLATQLKDYVECWEIYNEYTMDYPDYDKTDDVAMAAARDYADILKAGYDAVKSVDPNASVVGGAHAGSGVMDNFAGRLYDTFGAADYMDVHSFHAYCSGSDTSGEIDALNIYKNRFNGYAEAYGGKQQIYLDEFNFVTTGRLSVEEQAIYNVRLLTKERYLEEVDRIYTYNLESPSYGNTTGYGFLERPEDDYDYLKQTSAARPNYVAVSFMNKLLRLSNNVSFSEDTNGNYVYEFYDNIHERPIYVIWNKNDIAGSALIENTGTLLTAYDMYGNELSKAEGSIRVSTGKKPVYVAGPEKDFLIGQDDETYKVTISGIGTSGNNISSVVLSKGAQEADFTTVNQILYTDQKQIDSEGNWVFSFKITQGNGEYTILLTEENGERLVYNLTYNAGNLRVGYEFFQEQGGVYNFASLGDGNLNINYRIDNPENKKTGFVIFGCLYKGNELKKVVKTNDSELFETDLIKTGSIAIPDIKKSEIDKVQMLIFDGINNLCPLYQKFVLE